MKAALIGGVQSGCGKTTATLALMHYLHRAGYAIAPFKTGPDFIDPMWHRAVTGKPSYNLDTQMMGEAACRRRMMCPSVECIAIIEGVMGLFDGRDGVGGKGSSIDLARTLGVPVWLVIDAGGMSGSIVPLVAGFCAEAESAGVSITGIVANHVGSARHAGMLSGFLTERGLPPLIAWIDKQAPGLQERHLGLVMPEEVEIPDFSNNLHTEKKDLLAACGELMPSAEDSTTAPPRLTGKVIAIARDAACCFVYQENIDWLCEQGATIRYFSPLAGQPVPNESDAVWLPGGYPELHAANLSQSSTWDSLNQHIQAGKPALAECGGMMLLGTTLTDRDDHAWPMAGILPYATQMQDRLASLGYREDASGARGHEFHHSRRVAASELPPAFAPSRGDQGARYLNLRASYIHWWFPAAPEVTANWFGAAV